MIRVQNISLNQACLAYIFTVARLLKPVISSSLPLNSTVMSTCCTLYVDSTCLNGTRAISSSMDCGSNGMIKVVNSWYHASWAWFFRQFKWDLMEIEPSIHWCGSVNLGRIEYGWWTCPSGIYTFLINMWMTISWGISWQKWHVWRNSSLVNLNGKEFSESSYGVSALTSSYRWIKWFQEGDKF